MARGKYNGVGYDTDVDYTKEINKAVEMGDYAYAAALEKMRNAKIQGEGLNYGTTDNYSQYVKSKEPAVSVVKSAGTQVPSVKPGRTVQDKMNSVLGAINAKQFHYNPVKDPLYKQIQKNYKSTAGDVIENAMGTYSGMTGGVPSSYAMSAAAQAGAQHMQKADDMIPELYELAYNKFAQDKADLYKQYGIMQDLENREYERGIYEEEKNYERNLYAQQQAEAKAQAQAKAQADEETARLDYEKWLSEYGLDLSKAQDTEKKNALSTVMTMIENGSVPPPYMLEDAGLYGITGEQLLADYRAEGERVLQTKGKYSTSSVSVSNVKDAELKRPTTTMFDAIDELFEEGDGAEGIAKLKNKYDWSVYDEAVFDDYVKQHYGNEDGVSEYFYEPSFAEKYADKINTAFKKKNGDKYSALKANGDGTYSLSDAESAYIIKAVFEDDSLTQDEAESLLYDYFGITEKQVQDVLNDRHYR